MPDDKLIKAIEEAKGHLRAALATDAANAEQKTAFLLDGLARALLALLESAP